MLTKIIVLLIVIFMTLATTSIIFSFIALLRFMKKESVDCAKYAAACYAIAIILTIYMFNIN